MANVIETYKQKWQQLNNREQSLVAVMSVVVVVFLFYSLLWQPLNTNLIKSAKKLERRQALLTWVQTKTQQYQQVSKTGKRSGSSLTSIVNRTAKQKNLTVTRMQPQGDDLQIWVDEVPFEQLLAWLDQLVEQEGLVIKAIDIKSAADIGVVQVRRLQLGKS